MLFKDIKPISGVSGVERKRRREGAPIGGNTTASYSGHRSQQELPHGDDTSYCATLYTLSAAEVENRTGQCQGIAAALTTL
jgi:hypothetical protein